MRVEISNRPGALKTSGAGEWPVSIDQELLTETFLEAAGRAGQEQLAVLASFTQPVEWCDTIQAFTGARQAGLGECFFWEQPAEQNTLLGIGAEATIESNGSARFSDASLARRALMKDAIVTYAPATTPTAASGPVLFGGFAFDPLSPPTQLWPAFPAPLPLLPPFPLRFIAR